MWHGVVVVGEPVVMVEVRLLHAVLLITYCLVLNTYYSGVPVVMVEVRLLHAAHVVQQWQCRCVLLVVRARAVVRVVVRVGWWDTTWQPSILHQPSGRANDGDGDCLLNPRQRAEAKRAAAEGVHAAPPDESR